MFIINTGVNRGGNWASSSTFDSPLVSPHYPRDIRSPYRSNSSPNARSIFWAVYYVWYALNDFVFTDQELAAPDNFKFVVERLWNSREQHPLNRLDNDRLMMMTTIDWWLARWTFDDELTAEAVAEEAAAMACFGYFRFVSDDDATWWARTTGFIRAVDAGESAVNKNNSIEWNGMEWNRIEWNRIESNGIEWNRIESNRIEWNRMESNGMEWNEMKWNEMDITIDKEKFWFGEFPMLAVFYLDLLRRYMNYIYTPWLKNKSTRI